MKRHIRYFLAVIIAMLILGGCKMQSSNQDINIQHIDLLQPTEELIQSTENTKQKYEDERETVSRQLSSLRDGESWILGNLTGNLLSGGGVCEVGQKIYYRDDNNEGYLCRANLDFSEKEIMVEDIPYQIQVWNEWVYYYEAKSTKLKRVHQVTKEVEMIYSGDSTVFLVTDEGVFFLSSEGGLHKTNFDGTNDVLICQIDEEDSPRFCYLLLFGDYAFIGGAMNKAQDSKCRKLYVVNLDGGGYELLNDSIWQPNLNENELWYYVDGSKECGTKIVSLSNGKEYMIDIYTTCTVEYQEITYYGEIYSFGYIDDNNQPIQIYPDYNETGGNHNINRIYLAANKLFFYDYQIEEDELSNDNSSWTKPMYFYYYDLITKEIFLVP